MHGLTAQLADFIAGAEPVFEALHAHRQRLARSARRVGPADAPPREARS